VTFQPLVSPQKVANAELRARASSRSSGKYTRHFIVFENGEEVAFVSLDFNPGGKHLSIYEIFIPRGVRGRGIGVRLLQEVEQMAKKEGYGKVQLSARPSDDYPQAELAAWYKKRGYRKPEDTILDILEKQLG
jgi:ribosomal protein S18 acetylase RimI-like enzyme